MLVAVSGLGLLGMMDAAIERRTENLWCFNIFQLLPSRKLIVVVCLGYSLFSVWVLVGVCWFMLAQEDTECRLHAKENFDYYFIWLWFCYFWMTVYTCALLVSSLRAAADSDNDYYEGPLLRPLLPSAPGLSDNSLNTIVTAEVTSPPLQPDHCSVCIELISQGDTFRQLRCGHVFHQPCIDPWLRRNPHCPNCKRNQH